MDFITKRGKIWSMFETRVKSLKQKIKKEGLDAVLISSVSNIIYFTGFDGFFKEERDGYLLVTKDKAFVLTHSIYSTVLKNLLKEFEVIEVSRRDPASKVIARLLKNQSAKLGIEEHDLKVTEYKSLQKKIKELKAFSLNLRTIKNNQEINLIKRACEIGDFAFKKIIKKIKEGISEKELALKLEYLIKSKGADLSFKTIIAFGKNSSAPHHVTSSAKLEKGQIILIDFGVKHENYCSDMTRTVFFGSPSEKQIKIYETVLEAQNKAINFINLSIKNGKSIKAAEVDKMARDYILSKGYPSIPHSLGHGIGLDVHENPHLSPKSKEVLKEGMVFSIEPGIYIPGFGGVRIEDLYVFERGGLKQITTSPKNLIKLHRLRYN